MQKQMSLWPMAEESYQAQELWTTLDHDHQQQVIAALAHMIHKIVCTKKEKQTEGATNEQQ